MLSYPCTHTLMHAQLHMHIHALPIHQVSTAVRLCDGAIVVVDVAEGVCPQVKLSLFNLFWVLSKPINLYPVPSFFSCTPPFPSFRRRLSSSKLGWRASSPVLSSTRLTGWLPSWNTPPPRPTITCSKSWSRCAHVRMKTSHFASFSSTGSIRMK